MVRAQRMPPFTKEAQRWIWQRQNPRRSKCNVQRYLLGDNTAKQVRPMRTATAPDIVPQLGCALTCSI